MRQIVLDTETTGLNAATGDRIIEIGCVELMHRRLTGRNLHFYVNPQRPIDPGAIAVHGITNEFIADKPLFSSIVDELSDYLQDAELIIHNAQFDLGFLEAEYKLLGRPPFSRLIGNVIDTLLDARRMFPGKRNSLDALCDRLGVSNAHRKLHGALLDAELLAEVYLAMTRGQNTLVIDMLGSGSEHGTDGTQVNLRELELPVLRASEEEIAAHEAILDALEKSNKKASVWRALATPKAQSPDSQSA